ncbi:MAG: hypothetical protein M3463_02325 [Verrucomicrobiota bacterium]|nr:hypothetical protein [Verrucomicrobiota bacterium]
MSEPAHALTPPEAEKFDEKQLGRLPNLLLGVGVVCLLLSLIGALVAREQFAFSWLFAFSYFFSICVGALFWTCLHHATDAAWSVVVRRQLENEAALLPYFALFFIVLLLFNTAPFLWKWWNLGDGADALLDKKRPYLTQWFFLLRAAVYFLLLSWVALSLCKRSTAQDHDGAARHTLVMRKVGVVGIPVVALCLTFAGFDWLMGLDYHWFSTMWGVYLFAGAAGSSMSLLVLIVTALKARGYLKVVTIEHYHIMGKFMLAFVIFWAYIGFSQYMLIWYANIPEETIYYRIRNVGFWNVLSTFLVVGRFFLLLPVLLLQWTKKKPLYLCYAAGWVLFMQLIDIYVVVLPALHPHGFSPSILDLLTLAGIGGILGWLFFRKLGRSSLFPTRDPRLAESLTLVN